jgi:hypothetical protein
MDAIFFLWFEIRKGPFRQRGAADIYIDKKAIMPSNHETQRPTKHSFSSTETTDSCRHTYHHCPGGDIFCNNGAGTDDRIIANRQPLIRAWKNNRIHTNRYTVADTNRFR